MTTTIGTLQGTIELTLEGGGVNTFEVLGSHRDGNTITHLVKGDEGIDTLTITVPPQLKTQS